MATYIVKNGENLYDIALKLFGSVEGVFNLLVCNQDAIKETGLSLSQTIEAGTELSYTEGSVISQSVVDGLSSASVKNGERLYSYHFPNLYIESYVKKFNVGVVEKSLLLWPNIATSSDEVEIADYLDYLNTNCIWTDEFDSDDISVIVGGHYDKAETITLPARLNIPKLIVRQAGMESCFTYKMKHDGVMFIDWGDAQMPDIYTICNSRRVAEHCYEDEGEHVISVYGSFEFSYLDLTGIGGVYYPLSKISVEGEFITPFPNSSIINELIEVI